MWRDLYDTTRAVLSLARDVKQLQEDLTEQQAELRRLSIIVQRLAAHVEASDRHRSTEQENVLLKVRLELKDFEQRLNQQVARLAAPEKD